MTAPVRTDFPTAAQIQAMAQPELAQLALTLLHVFFDPSNPVSPPAGTPPQPADTPDMIYIDGAPLSFAQFQQRYGDPAWLKANPTAGWRFMVAQFKVQNLPHPWVQWEQGKLPDQAGDNTAWIDKYKEFKPMYQNAEPNQSGGAADFDFVVRQLPLGEAAFVANLKKLVTGTWGRDWLVNPATVGMRPSQAAIDKLLAS